MFFVFDKRSDELIYSRGYSTLFQEWQTTTESKSITKTMNGSVIMPFPKDSIIVEILRRNRRGEFHTKFSLTILPNNYFIKKEQRKKVEGIKCIHMMLGPEDESGRRKPIAMEGSEFEIICDQVIMAIGQGCNPLIAKSAKMHHDRACNVFVNEDMMTSIQGVFAGGDIIGGNSTVIEAMRDGKKAAKSIVNYLTPK